MNFYKFAQEVVFVNELNIKLKVSRMKDAEYSAYITTLSEVHSELKNSEADLKSIVENILGKGYAAISLISFIKDIGLNVFKNEDFLNISKKLDSFRAPKTKVDRVEPKKLDEGLTGLDTETEVSDKSLTVNEIMNMTVKQRYDYLSNIDYAPQVQGRVQQMLLNLKDVEEIYKDNLIPRELRENYRDEIVDIVNTLLSISENKDYFDDTEFESEDIIDEKTKEDVDKSTQGVKPKTPKEKKEPSQKKYTSNASAKSNLTRDEVFDDKTIFSDASFNVFIANSKNPYVDFSVMPPILNESMDLVYGNFLRKIDNIFQRALSDESSATLKKELNDAVFIIKSADAITYEVLKKVESEIPDEFKKQFKNVEHQFLTGCPTVRLFAEKDFLEKFILTTIYLSSPKVGKLFFAEDNKQILNESNKYPVVNESIADELKNVIEDFARNTVLRKANMFFKFENRYRESNFVDYLGLRWEDVFKRSLEKVIPEGPAYSLRSCPTCYKLVPWSYSKEARVHNKNLEGFKVRPVSIFTHDPERPKITLEFLQSRKWPAPPSDLYSREREQQLAIKYAKEGEKSWNQIQDLLISNDPEKHEEGWHRKMGALKAAGGYLLTTEDIFIRNSLNECPFDKNNPGKSACGISFKPTNSNQFISGKSTLQPRWNGIKDVAKNSGEQATDLIEDLWEDKNLFKEAKKLQSGGYKFSKLNFACTCRIKDIDSLSSYKHNNIAISKMGPAGSRNYVYPTQPDGSFDTNIEDGTVTYLVCGAPTSLSSFDRDPNSVGFILKYLRQLQQESMEDYEACINFFIKQGVDIQDILDFDSGLEKYAIQDLNKQSKIIQERLKKLATILLEEAGTGSELRKIISNLTLVCPFGHKFTVGHSLKFGQSYAGIYQKEGITKDFAEFVTTSGVQNIRSLIARGLLIRADNPEMNMFKNRAPFDEWIKIPEDQRLMFADFKKPEKTILLFPVEDIDGNEIFYVFAPAKKGGKGAWKEHVWPGDKSYTSYRDEKRTIQTNKNISTVSDIIDDGEMERNISDLATAKEWEIDQNNPIIEYDFSRPPTTVIPGTPEIRDEDEIDEDIIDQKIASFSRMLKSSLRIITTWTKGVVSETMLDALLSQYVVNIESFKNNILSQILPHLTITSFDGESLQPNEEQEVKRELGDYFVNRITHKVNSLYDWIRSNIHSLEENEDFDRQVAASIIYASILDFNNPSADIGFETGYGDVSFPPENFNELAKSISKKITLNNKNLVDVIVLKTTSFSQWEKRRNQYVGRINLIGYAQYLAQSLVQIYKKYCEDPNSEFYIGYDIGIDLSSLNKIIGHESEGKWVGGITENQVQSIVSSYKEAAAKPNSFKRLKPQTLHYVHRIDRAWEELESYLNQARKQATSARAMELSQEYIVNRMSFISGENIKDLRNQIVNIFPRKSILFKGTTENPETNESYLVTKRRLPFVSKETNFLKIPNTQKVDEWIVKNKVTREIRAFSTKNDAESFVNDLLSKDLQLNVNDFVIENDPYWINPDWDFDSSKSQIGMNTPKVTKDFKWPLEYDSWEFVGLNLPFSIHSHVADINMSHINPNLFPNYRFVIDFNGKPLDITFLIKKGNDDKEQARVIKAENDIINSVKDSRRNIEIFQQENAQQISQNPGMLARYVAEEESRLQKEVDSNLRLIDSISISLTTKSSYIDPTKPAEPRKMLRAVLENPKRAYKLIMNPETRGVILDAETQQDLLNFIIQVFNLEAVAALIRSSGGIFSDVRAIDVLENSDSNKFKFIGPKLKNLNEWYHRPGRYFTLIPGQESEDFGSYIQYIYNVAPNVTINRKPGQHLDTKTLVNASIAMNKTGIMTGEEGNSKEFIEKIEKDMLNYIKARTSGERKNDALDGKGKKRKKKAGTEYSYKIGLRERYLERIILSCGLDFEDVEIPNF